MKCQRSRVVVFVSAILFWFVSSTQKYRAADSAGETESYTTAATMASSFASFTGPRSRVSLQRSRTEESTRVTSHAVRCSTDQYVPLGLFQFANLDVYSQSENGFDNAAKKLT